MIKVMSYQEGRGLQTTTDADPMSEEELRKMTEKNKEKGREFLRLAKEAEKVKNSARIAISTRHNRALMGLLRLNIILGFKCPWLSQTILLQPGGLKFVKESRKELN